MLKLCTLSGVLGDNLAWNDVRKNITTRSPKPRWSRSMAGNLNEALVKPTKMVTVNWCLMASLSGISRVPYGLQLDGLPFDAQGQNLLCGIANKTCYRTQLKINWCQPVDTEWETQERTIYDTMNHLNGCRLFRSVTAILVIPPVTR